MKITRESDYAIRIILMLSSLKDGELAGAAKISETQCIPKQFTLKILRELVGAGYVKSFKGVCGGYAMNVLPKDVSLKDVITAIEGDIAINDCLDCQKECNRVKNVSYCPVHNKLVGLNNTIKDELSKITFQSLLDEV